VRTPADVARTALIGQRFSGPSRQVLRVADGIELSIPAKGPVEVRNNVAVLPKTTTVIATSQGVSTRLRLRRAHPTAFLPVGQAFPPPTVPDLTGLDTTEAGTVLRAARLYDGLVDARPVANVAPGTVIGQVPAAGGQITARTEVRLTVSSLAGPDGARQPVTESTTIRWLPPFPEPPGRGFQSTKLSRLAGKVTEVLFARTRPQAQGGPCRQPVVLHRRVTDDRRRCWSG
jgi:PASTA domain